ncbi:MAG: hypothetical protein CMB84_04580 [Flammeovirgaceae bacterium]|nr:hypothetical protein [Flammeovirgaceae bacterium]|tara:strand:+ start:14 stop:532 length:519 start_codon:yes stop_codon:yes gene_type:complete
MRYLLPLLFLFVCSSCSDEDSDLNPGKGLIINEFLASNDACCSDNFGDYDDWVELYNDSNEPIDIGGMYFTDTPDDDSPYLIPSTDPSSTTIQPGGYLLLWCDDDQEQGALHVSKKLSKGGESIILIDKDGSSVITSYTYETQSTDVSMGRDPSNNESWIYFNIPTPGSVNN